MKLQQMFKKKNDSETSRKIIAHGGFFKTKELSIEDFDKIFFSGHSEIRQFFCESTKEQKVRYDVFDRHKVYPSKVVETHYKYKLTGRLYSEPDILLELGVSPCLLLKSKIDGPIIDCKFRSWDYQLNIVKMLDKSSSESPQYPIACGSDITNLYEHFANWDALKRMSTPVLQEFEQKFLSVLEKYRR